MRIVLELMILFHNRNAVFVREGGRVRWIIMLSSHNFSESEKKKIFNPINTFLFVLSIKWLLPLACHLTRAVLIVHCHVLAARGYVGKR